MQTDTRDILAHATKQAESYEDYFLVDIDAHVTETSFWPEILASIDNEVIRQMGQADRRRVPAAATWRCSTASRACSTSTSTAASRTSRRCWSRSSKARHPSFRRARAPLDGCDGPRLSGRVPDADADARHASAGRHRGRRVGAAYNKWLVERILPEDDRLKGMIYLPFNTPEACVEEVKKYADVDSIIGYYRRARRATSRCITTTT